MVLKTYLHGQMTETIAFEVRPKNGQKLQKEAQKSSFSDKIKVLISLLFLQLLNEPTTKKSPMMKSSDLDVWVKSYDQK